MTTYLPIQLGPIVKLQIEASDINSLPINLSRTLKISVSSSSPGLQNLASIITIQKNTILGSYLRQVLGPDGTILRVEYNDVVDAYWEDVTTIQSTGTISVANDKDIFFRILVKAGEYNAADLILLCSLFEETATEGIDPTIVDAIINEVSALIEASGKDHLVNKGTLDASTGIAYDLHGSSVGALTDATGISGEVYEVTVAGAVDFGSGPITLAINELIVHNGTVWEILVHGATSDELSYKEAVRAASTLNVDISTDLIGGSLMDGVTLVAGDRVLLKDQITASENGIRIVVVSGASPRSPDANISAEVTDGMSMFVSEGVTNADQRFTLTTNNPIILDTTNLTFVKTSGLGQIIAGAALSKTGNTLDVNVDNSTIEVIADALSIKDGGVDENKIINTALGDGLEGGSGTTITVKADTVGGANLSRSINIDSDGLSVKIDGISIIEGASNRLEVGEVDAGTF